jgi:hypothetical protein
MSSPPNACQTALTLQLQKVWMHLLLACFVFDVQ